MYWKKEWQDEKDIVIPFGAVLFPLVLTESVLLLGSIGLSSVYCILTLVLPILITLEDQLIMLTSDGIVC